MSRTWSFGLLVVVFVLNPLLADNKWGLKEGTPDIKSAGHLAFGPDGILFVGDAKGAAVFAFATDDTQGEAKADREIADLIPQLSKVTGATPIAVNDLAVNPLSGNIYLSLSVGADAAPGLAKIDGSGAITEIKLAKLAFQKATLPNPPEDKVTGEGPKARNRRNEAITDLAYAEGKVLVAGLINAAAPSTIRELAFPFAKSDEGTPIEIYHAAHAKVENYAAIRTFIPFNVNGSPSLLAGFTCTPLVRFPLKAIDEGKPVRGTTVAELGNRNTPLDMITYTKGGETYLLMANNNRGVMKISTKEIGRDTGLTSPVSGGGVAGQTYETIKELEGTVQLDRLGEAKGIVLVMKDGKSTLKTIILP